MGKHFHQKDFYSGWGREAVLQVKEQEQRSSRADFEESGERYLGCPGPRAWKGRVWIWEPERPELKFGTATYPCDLGQLI